MISSFRLLLLILLSSSTLFSQSLQPSSFAITSPDLVLYGTEFRVEVTALGANGTIDTSYNGRVEIDGIYRVEKDAYVPIVAQCVKGKVALQGVHVERTGEVVLVIRDGNTVSQKKLRAIPGLLSILPPLFAIVLALTIRQVIISLFAGVWLGALFIHDYDPITGAARVIDHFIIRGMADPDHVSIVVFSFMFGGMVGIISKNGGTHGIANRLITMASTARRGQIASWLLGVVIFFDDYANTLIVGNTMRPITDKLKISREKLAYIVDSTSAPVSSLFFISTWIGYEVGLIDAAIKSIDYHVENAYWIFIDTIPYRFYPILTLILGFAVAFTGRDFGPMLRAERRARLEGKLHRDGAQLATDLPESANALPAEGIPHRWWNGAIPILTVILVGIGGLYYTGVESIASSGGTDFSLGNIVGSANSYKALLWASLASCAVAIILSIAQRLLTAVAAMDAWFHGVKSMLYAMIILNMAWSIGAVTMELHTADYLVQILKGNLASQWLPVLTFLVAAIISFATGTSWGTMGILMPLVIPLAYALSSQSGMNIPEIHIIMLGTVSSVLAGSVFGDHCSPISDTTILSSMASACDHVDHVRTQLPYAFVAAIIGMIVGDIPTAFGLSPYLSIVLGAGVVTLVLFAVGKKDELADVRRMQ
ncbi:MAG: Na+/H+ antiporter NhaC family protein [Ignavibacteriae bacterium]|nr:Na+/H+ antiporter NhaC family protein [Ignavibacteriota bacterium]